MRLGQRRHTGRITLEAADAEQRADLLLDFAWPLVVIAFVVGVGLKVGLTQLPELAGIPLALATAALGILVVRSRTRRVAAGVDGTTLIVRNLLWSYRVSLPSVTTVISRRSWFGGIYATCLGVRTSTRKSRLRAIPVHAVAAGRAPADLQALIEGFAGNDAGPFAH